MAFHNKNLVKKFILLHILYGKKKIDNVFTKQVLATNFAFKITFKGTNAISVGLPQLGTCYEIFILYLAKHLNWFLFSENLLQERLPFIFLNQPPSLIISSEVRPPAHVLCWKGFSNHRAVRHRDSAVQVESLTLEREGNSDRDEFSIVSPFTFCCTILVGALILSLILLIWYRVA